MQLQSTLAIQSSDRSGVLQRKLSCAAKQQHMQLEKAAMHVADLGLVVLCAFKASIQFCCLMLSSSES